MKRELICCCLILVCLGGLAQRTVDVDKDTSVGTSALNHMYIVGSVPFVLAKFSRVVEGSPFFNKEMMRGAIILSKGSEYKNVLIRLNLLETQVNYIDEKQMEMIATTPVREVVLWDTIAQKDHRFVYSKYIETRGVEPGKDFYELLYKGKAELYKQYKKDITESKPYGSATYEQTIHEKALYYVLLNGKWTRAKKLKDLSEILSNQKNKIQQFISDNKLYADNDDNFVAVIGYYNSLVTPKQ
jgi:hypothetical protein